MKFKNLLSLFFSGTLVVCALVITTLVIRQEFFPQQPEQILREVQNWEQLELRGWETGPSDAPIQIIEFFDYQCPYCKKIQPVIQAIKEKYGDIVSINYEHFPLEGHSYAFDAAVASECARMQDSFPVFHKQLFANQELLGTISYDSLATIINIKDTETFNECIEDQKTAEIIHSGKQLGNALGISGIPTFVINGSLVTGALSQRQIEDLIQKKLQVK